MIQNSSVDNLYVLTQPNETRLSCGAGKRGDILLTNFDVTSAISGDFELTFCHYYSAAFSRNACPGSGGMKLRDEGSRRLDVDINHKRKHVRNYKTCPLPLRRSRGKRALRKLKAETEPPNRNELILSFSGPNGKTFGISRVRATACLYVVFFFVMIEPVTMTDIDFILISKIIILFTSKLIISTRTFLEISTYKLF